MILKLIKAKTILQISELLKNKAVSKISGEVKKKMAQKKMWCLQVQRVSGEYRTLRLSNELQEALAQEPANKKLLKGALIVIPLAPYYKNKQRPDLKRQPPMGVAWVQDIFQLSAKKTYRLADARGQFISAAYWPQRARVEVQKYLKHDYAFWSQQQIKSDVKFWQKQRHTKNKKAPRLIRVITNKRIRHQIKKINRQRVRQNQSFWQLKKERRK